MDDQTIIIKTVVEKVSVSDLTQREKQIYEAGYYRGAYDKLHCRFLVGLFIVGFAAYIIIKLILP